MFGNKHTDSTGGSGKGRVLGMGTATPREYARLWLKQAISKTWNIGDAVSGAAGAVLAAVAHFSPPWGREMSGSLWLVPVYALAATALFRLLFFAPYELWAGEKRRADSSQGKLVSIGSERPFKQFKTEFLFVEDQAGQLTSQLAVVALHHRNSGAAPIKYTLQEARLEVNGTWHELGLSNPESFVHGETEGWHRCVLPAPVDLAPLPALLRVTYDYVYDTVPPVTERRAGATMRFVMRNISPEKIDGVFYEDIRL